MLWALSALGWAKKAARAALGFVTRYPWQTALIISLVAVAWLWRANNGLHARVKAERAAHVQTIVNYRVAQKKAEAAQSANLVRVADEQDAISERISDDFETRLADARARYQRLLAQGNRSASGSAGLPATSEGPGEPVEASGQDGLSLADRLIATEQAIQLGSLIQWVNEQSAVATSPEPIQ